jgi:hypothetical protein
MKKEKCALHIKTFVGDAKVGDIVIKIDFQNEISNNKQMTYIPPGNCTVTFTW